MKRLNPKGAFSRSDAKTFPEPKTSDYKAYLELRAFD